MPLRILFMGTAELARASLQALLASALFEVAAVVTYIRTSWGNRGTAVSARQANELRSATLN